MTVTLGSAACTNPVATHNQITCTVPAGQGTSLPLVAVVDGQASNSLSLGYAAPSLGSISPTSGSTAGGYNLTLSGNNFATTGALVTVGGLSCPVVSQTHTQVICTMPPGEGVQRDVVVSVSGQASVARSFSYSKPTITNVGPQNQTTAV